MMYSIKLAKVVLEIWRLHYDTLPPHSSLGRWPSSQENGHPQGGITTGEGADKIDLSKPFLSDVVTLN